MATKGNVGTQSSEQVLTGIADMLAQMNARMDQFENLVKSITHTEVQEMELTTVTDGRIPEDELTEDIWLMETYIGDLTKQLEELGAPPSDASEVIAYYQRKGEIHSELLEAEEALADMRAKAEGIDTGDDFTGETDAKAAGAEPALVRKLRTDEMTIGRTHAEYESKHARNGDITFPVGTLVTMYSDGSDPVRTYIRAWAKIEGKGWTSRTLKRDWVFGEDDKLHPEHMRKISRARGIKEFDRPIHTPQGQKVDDPGKVTRTRKDQTTKARKPEAIAALRTWLENHEYAVLKGEVKFPKGTEVKTRSNGTMYVKSADNWTPSVPANIVKAGKLTKEVVYNADHFTRKLSNHVKRHNTGDCNCAKDKSGKTTWVCTAVQVLGTEPLTVGAITYKGTKGTKAEGFDPTIAGVSPTLLGKLNADVWGIEQD